MNIQNPISISCYSSRKCQSYIDYLSTKTIILALVYKDFPNHFRISPCSSLAFCHSHGSNYQISPMTEFCERILDNSNKSVNVSDREKLFRQVLVPLKPFNDVTWSSHSIARFLRRVLLLNALLHLLRFPKRHWIWIYNFYSIMTNIQILIKK